MTQLTQIDLSAADGATGQETTVLAAFAQLPVGDSLEWSQTHDPLTLHQALMAQWAGQFSWTRQEQDGDRWTLRLMRKPAGKSCCGCCGG